MKIIIKVCNIIAGVNMKKIMCLMVLFSIIIFVSCGGDGSSGGEPGPVPEPPRFTDNGDGTVTDNYTTLIWLKDLQNPEVTGLYGLKSWEVAMNLGYTNYMKNEQLAWHLPNVREMMSLMDYTKTGPALSSGYPFLHILTAKNSWYWTSTTDESAIQNAWCIDLYDGTKKSVNKTGISASMMLVRIPSIATNTVARTGQNMIYNPFESSPSACPSGSACRHQDGYLRLGDAWVSPRFTNLNDGKSVKDNMTSLVWFKKLIDIPPKTWGDADAYCKNLTDGPWRLPTMVELETLLDASLYDPAIVSSIATYFTGYVSDKYWTSTPYATNSSYAWFVDFFDGSVSTQSKASSSYVWPVRGPIVGD
jgi:hypothetical protein